VGKNHTWPDADMLPLGKLRVTSAEGGGAPSKFTDDEQQTVMTLWSIFRSPLIFGGDLPSNDSRTTRLITNEEVLEVNQHSSGGHQVLDKGGIRAWVAQSRRTGERYIAVFNLADTEASVNLGWDELGIKNPVTGVRDLWIHQPLDAADGLRRSLRPHASALYKVVLTSH
jgi:hypothetical protein